MTTGHNKQVDAWREATEALTASIGSLLGKRVLVVLPWHDVEVVGTVTRVNAMKSSVFGKSLSIKPDDPKIAGCGSMSGVGPQHVTVLPEEGQS